MSSFDRRVRRVETSPPAVQFQFQTAAESPESVLQPAICNNRFGLIYGASDAQTLFDQPVGRAYTSLISIKDSAPSATSQALPRENAAILAPDAPDEAWLQLFPRPPLPKVHQAGWIDAAGEPGVRKPCLFGVLIVDFAASRYEYPGDIYLVGISNRVSGPPIPIGMI
ncbi:uncharacterized protein BDV17DRAFT_249679 [Aspergillus undulatus]|uniref:uncharacterized protein n=1 Tax=Aspergillus undulatus TaxID=1810928 RepID=UPI003CCCD3E9